MANSSSSRAFQSYKSNNSKICSSSTRLKSSNSFDEPLIFGRMPYSSIRKSLVKSSSPDNIIKPPSIMTPKRRSSTVILNSLLPRRKSLQTTAIATRRQSLWMSIAKTESSSNDFQISLLPLRQEQNSLIRKKFLRLLLVFSYFLSISLLAVGLATFYGFFWSGYSPSKSTTISDISSTVQSIISLKLNSTYIDYESEIENIN